MGNDDESKAEVNNWLNTGPAAAEYNIEVVKPLNRYYKCLNVEGDCGEK